MRARPRRTRGRVDEAVAEVDVGEQPAVDVAALDANTSLTVRPVEQMVGEVGRPPPVALDRSAGLDRLRRVNADQADVLVLAVDPRSKVSPSTTRTTGAVTAAGADRRIAPPTAA